MRNLKPVNRSTLGEQVALQIIQLIAKRKWPPGYRIPSEADLCATLQVGRSTIREALRSLAFVGIIRIVNGGGSYVSDERSDLIHHVFNQGLLSSEVDIRNLTEVRVSLECQSASLCAERRTDGNLESLNDLVKSMELSAREKAEDFLSLDLEFHMTIAEASQNILLSKMLSTIRDLLIEYISKSQQLRGARKRAAREHQLILDAIKNQDSQRASEFMRQHLEKFFHEFVLLETSRKSAG